MTTLYVVRLSYEDLTEAYVGEKGRVLTLSEAEVFYNHETAQREADQWRTLHCDAFPISMQDAR